MTGIIPTESRALAIASGLLAPAPRPSSGDSIIILHLGPGQTPEVARLLRSAWPSLTALNYSEGREFHVRLRQHRATGTLLVYASVSRSPENQHQPSIFGDVVQRGRLCRSHAEVVAAIQDIRKELGLPTRPGRLGR